MAQNVIIEAIPGENVGRQVAVVVQPVVCEFLGAQHQHRTVAQFVIFHNGQSRECFTKPHAVGQDAAVVGFQLVDNAYGGITLKVEKLVPDQRILITRAVVGKDVFVDIVEEIAEDVVEHQEVDSLWRIFLIDRRDMITDCGGYIFKFCWIIPDLVKELKVCRCKGRLVYPVDDVGNGITLLISQIHSGEAMQRHICRFQRRPLNAGKLLHRGFGLVGAESGFAAHPFGTLAGNSTLGELIAKLDFKFGAVEAAFPVGLGNKELSTFLSEFVGDFVGNKGRCGEDEFQRIYLCKLRLEGFIGIDRKARCCDFQFVLRVDGGLQIVTQQRIDIVDDLHRPQFLVLPSSPLSFISFFSSFLNLPC